MSQIYLDEAGYQEYLEEIEKLRERMRKNSIDMAEYQSDDAYGDGWHDNFAYEQSVQKDYSLSRELEERLKRKKDIIIVQPSHKKDIVDLNAMVSLKFDGESEIEKFFISGRYQSDFDAEIPIITLNSELGKAIYKKNIHDTFSYQVNENPIRGEIIEIHYDDNR